MTSVVDRAVQLYHSLNVSELPEFLERTNLVHNNIDQYVEAFRVFEENKNKNTLVTKSEAMKIIGVCSATFSKYVKEGLLTNVAPNGMQPRYILEQVQSIKKGKYTTKLNQSVPSGARDYRN